MFFLLEAQVRGHSLKNHFLGKLLPRQSTLYFAAGRARNCPTQHKSDYPNGAWVNAASSLRNKLA